jgi:hypothetical protein
MNKLPREYNREEFEELLHKIITIEYGPFSSNEITGKVTGYVIKTGCASKPIDISILQSDGSPLHFDIYEMKSIEVEKS